MVLPIFGIFAVLTTHVSAIFFNAPLNLGEKVVLPPIRTNETHAVYYEMGKYRVVPVDNKCHFPGSVDDDAAADASSVSSRSGQELILPPVWANETHAMYFNLGEIRYETLKKYEATSHLRSKICNPRPPTKSDETTSFTTTLARPTSKLLQETKDALDSTVIQAASILSNSLGSAVKEINTTTETSLLKTSSKITPSSTLSTTHNSKPANSSMRESFWQSPLSGPFDISTEKEDSASKNTADQAAGGQSDHNVNDRQGIPTTRREFGNESTTVYSTRNTAIKATKEEQPSETKTNLYTSEIPDLSLLLTTDKTTVGKQTEPTSKTQFLQPTKVRFLGATDSSTVQLPTATYSSNGTASPHDHASLNNGSAATAVTITTNITRSFTVITNPSANNKSLEAASNSGLSSFNSFAAAQSTLHTEQATEDTGYSSTTQASTTTVAEKQTRSKLQSSILSFFSIPEDEVIRLEEKYKRPTSSPLSSTSPPSSSNLPTSIAHSITGTTSTRAQRLI